MGHKPATSSRGSRTIGDDRGGKTAYPALGMLSGKRTVLAITAMASLAVVVFAVTREAAMTGHETTAALSHSPAAPPKPAFTRPEEAYIQALWPIHGEVERTTVRMTLGKILYKTNDIGKADLKTRTDAALVTYRRAEGQLIALQPPPSFTRNHDEYLEALRLFEQSTLELLKMFDDDNDEHLLVAYPLSQVGSTKIRAVGARFWQDEFPPN